MELAKIFSSDSAADQVFSSVDRSVSDIKAMQKRKVAENVQIVIQALKKIESDLQDRFDGVTTVLEKRVNSLKDGKDGFDGRNGRDGKDGRPGRDGAPGARGPAGVPGTNGRDGKDGVSVTDARIDFDGSLIISLSSGREINVGEVVAPDLAEKIKVITNGGGTSQSVLDSLASLQTQITALQNLGAVNYVGTWNASTNSPTITSGSGDKGDYYVVSVAGSTNIDGQTLWGVGDWIIFNGAVWQKVDGGSTGDFTNLSASGTVTFTGLNASQAVFTNGSDQLVSNAVTGTGNVVMSASPTLTGTASLAALTTSSTVTHNGGTANGVAYLNGSKVLTTGSALTFDGTNFQVGGNSQPIIRAVSSSTNNATARLFTDGDTVYVGSLNLSTVGANVPVVFQLSGSEKVRINDAGNFGIGTTNPLQKLVVSNAGAEGLEISPTAIASGSALISYDRSGAAYTQLTAVALRHVWQVSGTESARITSTGYFKASNAGTYLNSTGDYHELRSSNDNYLLYAINTRNGGGGPFGISVEYSAQDPNGTGNEFLQCVGISTLRAEIRSNGGLANYSANDVNLSDRREKTNFAPAKSYLDTICAIPVQTFNYIDQSEDDPGLTLGVVAQDVQAVAPELVMESNWGTEDNPKMRLSIYQTDLQYALMKCIQELKAEVDSLKAQLNGREP